MVSCGQSECVGNLVARTEGRSSVASLEKAAWLSQDTWLEKVGNIVDDRELPGTSGALNKEKMVLDYTEDDDDVEERTDVMGSV